VKISVVILTFNSQKHLHKVLESAKFADEVLILDSFSTDNTVEIAQQYDVNIYTHQWLGFGKMKQKAVDLAKNRWVFVLDSDEIISNSLRDEILSLPDDSNISAYFVPRLNYFFGKAIRYGGLYPDKTIRLFDKSKAKFSEDEVHERVIVQNGRVGELKGDMIHYAYDDIESFISKQNRYSTLGAKRNRFKALFSPMWTFIKMYIIKRGFLDGWEGYIIARLYSQYTFWKYIKGSR